MASFDLSHLLSWLTDNVGFAGRSAIIAIVGYFFVRLVYPILFPTVISYPWPTCLFSRTTTTRRNSYSKKKKTAKTTAVLAGSYNPPHNGHLAMLEYLSEQFDQVIAVVGMNPNKQYAVTPRERATLIEKMLADSTTTTAKNVKVRIVSDYIWRHLKRTSLSRQDYRNMVFCRGIRSWEKDGRDEQYLQFQNTWGPLVLGPLTWPLPTIYLEGNPEYNHVSSSLIRSIVMSDSSSSSSSSSNKNATSTTMIQELRKLVPPVIAEDVARLYGK